MIELRVEGKCKGCPMIEPEIHKMYAGGRIEELSVSCKNLPLCQHLEMYIAQHPFRGPEPFEFLGE